MKATVNRLMKLGVAVVGLMLVATFFLVSTLARTSADDDTAALFKSKCFACHGATAEKKFDATKADDELIQTVLNGKQMEKPPNMPKFSEKGITADQAKALVAYMKSLKH